MFFMFAARFLSLNRIPSHKMRQKFIEQIIKYPSSRRLRVAARRFSKQFIFDFYVNEIHIKYHNLITFALVHEEKSK